MLVFCESFALINISFTAEVLCVLFSNLESFKCYYYYYIHIMGILTYFKKKNIEKKLANGLDDARVILLNLELIKKELKQILSHPEGSPKFFEHICDAGHIDRKILIELMRQDDAVYRKAKEVLEEIKDLARPSEHENLIHLVKHINKVIDSIKLTEELHLKKQTEVIDDFHYLLEYHELTNELISKFIQKHSQFFKLKTNKRLKKKIEKYLKLQIEEIILNQPGPTVTEREFILIKNKLKEYIHSDYFMKFIRLDVSGVIHIRISLYGSLVTGFASQYSKHKGLPTDFERISDVDLGIVIETKTIKQITLEGRCLFKEGQYHGPYYESNAEKLGPFNKIFHFLRDLSFAKRRDRKIGLVVVDQDFYKHNLADDEHIDVFKENVRLS